MARRYKIHIVSKWYIRGIVKFLKYILKDRKKRVIMNEVPVNAFQSNLEYFDTKKSATDMNNDLKVIGKWANQWKVSFNLIL